MAHDFAVDPSGNIVINIGYNLGQLAGGIHHETVPVNVSGTVSTLDFASKSVLQFTVTGDLSGSYTLPPSNIPALTQNATRTILAIEYTQDATGGRAIPLETLFANAANSTHMGNPSVDLAAGGKTRVKLVIFRSAGTIFTHAEFLPQHTHANISVGTQHSLTGGGTLAASRTLALVGDTASPGASKYYGTNAGSTRGFYDLPAGGGGGSTTLGGLTDVTDVLAPSNGQVLTYSSGTGLWQAGTITAPEGSGTVVANIAALQAIATPTDGQFVFVRGYSTATDGGGGLFQWHAASTDYKMVTGVTVAAGGTGYTTGQMVWIGTGTPISDYGYDCYIRVTSVSGGVVTGVSVMRGGKYTVTPTASAGATGTSGAGTGLTVNATIASWSNRGTIFPKSGGGVGRWLRRYEGNPNVLWFGAVGDNSTDCADAIQAAVDTLEDVFFPAGDYKIFRAITWFSGMGMSIHGQGISMWGTSVIHDGRGGNSDEAMFHPFGRYLGQNGTFVFERGQEISGGNLGGVGNSISVKNLKFFSLNSIYGTVFETGLQQNAAFYDCYFYATFRCLSLLQAQFDTLVSNCRFESTFMNSFAWDGTTGGESNKVIAKRAWGLFASGHKTILNCSFVGCGVGAYITGIENVMIGARIEVNYYGIIAGNTMYYFDGPVASSVTRSLLQGISLEANTYGVLIESFNMSVMKGFAAQGSEAAPPRPRSEYGIYIENMGTGSEIANFSAEGDFKYTAVVNLSTQSAQKYSSSSPRAYGGINSAFLFRGWRPLVHLQNSMSQIGSLTYSSDLRHDGLSQLDLRTASVRSRNLGGRVTVAQGAQTASVTFQEEVGIALVAFSSITSVADGASTLPAGTYYYATTVVAWNGEVGVNYSNPNAQNHRSITIGSGQRVDMQFYSPPGTASKYVRRIYRADSAGHFLGYWQIAIGANFSDTNNIAFTAGGMPPADGSLPNTEEDDANYHINLTAQGWNAGNVWVTNKTTTGFTINCSTVAPSGGGQISWLMYRA